MTVKYIAIVSKHDLIVITFSESLASDLVPWFLKMSAVDSLLVLESRSFPSIHNPHTIQNRQWPGSLISCAITVHLVQEKVFYVFGCFSALCVSVVSSISDQSTERGVCLGLLDLEIMCILLFSGLYQIPLNFITYV